jgi:hypothetical protein
VFWTFGIIVGDGTKQKTRPIFFLSQVMYFQKKSVSYSQGMHDTFRYPLTTVFPQLTTAINFLERTTYRMSRCVICHVIGGTCDLMTRLLHDWASSSSARPHRWLCLPLCDPVDGFFLPRPRPLATSPTTSRPPPRTLTPRRARAPHRDRGNPYG